MAMLRTELIKTQEYVKKRELYDEPADQRTHAGRISRRAAIFATTLARVLKGDVRYDHANRVQDIDSVLRLADEFKIRVWLDMASEAYELLPARFRRRICP
jgi:hypothetical protein